MQHCFKINKKVSDKIVCEFTEGDDYNYTCTISNARIPISNIEFFGNHVHRKHNGDVKTLIIEGGSMPYLPSDLFIAFMNLEVLRIRFVDIKIVDKQSFFNAEKLETLEIKSSSLSHLPSDSLSRCLKLKSLVLLRKCYV